MASRYEISTIFKMIDNFSGPMKSIAGSSSVMAKKVSADMQKTKMQIQAAGHAMKAMAGVAAAAGVALAGKTVVDSVKTYVEFEDAVTKAGTKFKDLDVTSESYNDTLEKMQTAAREVGALTKFSAVDSANALEKMAMAGLTSEQAMGMLMGTTNLAASVGLDLTSAVDMATDAMGAFNLVSEDQEQISANMNRIADVVAKTTNMANLDMEMWFESVKMGASTFTSLGGTIEEFSAYAGTLANAGIKGGMAGNALKNIMLNLSAPAKAGADALKELGINVFDAQGKMLPLTDVMKQFEKNLAGVADDRKAALLKDIFGKEQISSFNVLLSAGSKNLADFTKTLENAGGTAEKVAKAQMNSTAGLIEQLKSAWQDKQIQIGKAFIDNGGKDALLDLIAQIQKLDVTPFANAMVEIVKQIPEIASGISKVVSFLWDMRGVIAKLVIAWGIYKSAVVAALIIEKVMEFVSVLKNLQVVTTVMTKAQKVLNAVMSANPILKIIMLVFGLIEAIQWCCENFDTIKEYASAALSAIGDFFTWLWNGMKNIGTAIGDFFVKLGKNMLAGLLWPIQKMVEFLSNIPFVGGVFQGWADSIKEFREGLLGIEKSMPTITYTAEELEKLRVVKDKWEQGSYISDVGIKNGWGLSPAMNAMAAQIRLDLAAKGAVTAPVTAPVTQGERTAYSVSETNNNTSTEVTVTLDKGLKGSVSSPAPNVTVQSTSSAAWK